MTTFATPRGAVTLSPGELLAVRIALEYRARDLEILSTGRRNRHEVDAQLAQAADLRRLAEKFR